MSTAASTKQPLAVEWKPGYVFASKADPHACSEELDTIDKKTPEKVVKKASDRKSSLHGCFTWDRSRAAHLYNLHEARSLMGALVVRLPVVEGGESDSPAASSTQPLVRGYTHVTTVDREEDDPSGFYERTEDLLADPDYRAQVLKRARAEAKSWASRYRHLRELSDVVNAIDRID